MVYWQSFLVTDLGSVLGKSRISRNTMFIKNKPTFLIKVLFFEDGRVLAHAPLDIGVCLSNCRRFVISAMTF